MKFTSVLILVSGFVILNSCEEEIVINTDFFDNYYYSHIRIYEYSKDTISDTLNYYFIPGETIQKIGPEYITTNDTIVRSGIKTHTLSFEIKDGNKFYPASPPYIEYPQNPLLDLDLFIYPKWEIITLTEKEMNVNFYYGNGKFAEKIILIGFPK